MPFLKITDLRPDAEIQKGLKAAIEDANNKGLITMLLIAHIVCDVLAFLDSDCFSSGCCLLKQSVLSYIQ